MTTPDFNGIPAVVDPSRRPLSASVLPMDAKKWDEAGLPFSKPNGIHDLLSRIGHETPSRRFRIEMEFDRPLSYHEVSNLEGFISAFLQRLRAGCESLTLREGPNTLDVETWVAQVETITLDPTKIG